MSHELRPYQDAAVDETFRVWEEHRRALVVMPTGTGKTLVFAKVAERMRRHGRVLVLAHREELIRQACDKIATWTSLSTAVEMGAERADGIFGAAADVVVASVQSLARRARLERFDASAFGLVIVDEAHHAPADTYQRVLDHFATAKVLGVTGTPDRLDGQGSAGSSIRSRSRTSCATRSRTAGSFRSASTGSMSPSTCPASAPPPAT